jgi:hypothetical protein
MNTPNRFPHHEAALPRFVAASLDDIRYAEELRRQIEQRYLTPSEQPAGPYRTTLGS